MSISENTTFHYAAYLFFFILAVIFSVLINGLLLKFSKTLGDRHEQHRHVIRWSSHVKPSVGGFSFYILFLISLSINGIFHFENGYANNHLLGMTFAATLGFMLGLADDAYNTYPWLKFSGQLLCGIFLVATDTMIHATNIYVIDALLTLIWTVGIMNSINMLDNMDGISGIASLFILLGCLLVLALGNNFFSFNSLILLGVSGALIGFLFFNRYPARIYMGDTGSQFLGAFLAATSIQILWQYHDSDGPVIQLRQFLFPLVAFAVPLIDTTTVFIRRIARGQSPFVGGRDHITHHFAYAGLNDRQVFYLLAMLSFISAFLTGILVWWGEEIGPGMVCVFYGYVLAVFLVTQYYYDIGKKKEEARLQSNHLTNGVPADTINAKVTGEQNSMVLHSNQTATSFSPKLEKFAKPDA